MLVSFVYLIICWNYAFIYLFRWYFDLTRFVLFFGVEIVVNNFNCLQFFFSRGTIVANTFSGYDLIPETSRLQELQHLSVRRICFGSTQWDISQESCSSTINLPNPLHGTGTQQRPASSFGNNLQQRWKTPGWNFFVFISLSHCLDCRCLRILQK